MSYFYKWTPLILIGTLCILALPWLGLIALFVVALVVLPAIAWVAVYLPYRLSRAIGRGFQAYTAPKPRPTAAVYQPAFRKGHTS